MPGLGGTNPFPMRFGGGKSRTAIELAALNAQRGSAYDTSEESEVYLTNLVTARIVAGMWSTNQRMANQVHPELLTGSGLRRWETILHLAPAPTDTEVERRRRVLVKRQAIGKRPSHAYLTERLTAECGVFFVAVEYISVDNANIHVPDGSWPFGTVAEGYPWMSTVAHVLVRMQKPDGATEAEFYAAAGEAIATIDPLLPAWISLDWYRAPLSTPIEVAGGPSAAGFYLDDDHNLDNNVFDI